MSATIDRWTDEDGYVDWLHPMALAAKANSADNPTWNEAMNGSESRRLLGSDDN
jgi:hypothetical protein